MGEVSTYLCFVGPTGRLAVATENVERIANCADHDERVLDLRRWTGDVGREEERAALVRYPGGHCWLRCGGQMTFLRPHPSQLLPLPAYLGELGAHLGITGLLMSEEGPMYIWEPEVWRGG